MGTDVFCKRNSQFQLAGLIPTAASSMYANLTSLDLHVTQDTCILANTRSTTSAVLGLPGPIYHSHTIPLGRFSIHENDVRIITF